MISGEGASAPAAGLQSAQRSPSPLCWGAPTQALGVLAQGRFPANPCPPPKQSTL